jgi:hypothetical protein
MHAPVSQRALMLRLLGVAVAVALVQAATGMTDLALYCTPLLLIATLLLSGRYLGETRILRAIARARPRLRRAVPRLRRPHTAERTLSSSLERSPLSRRGPPALAAA